jgi:hypothetical protein
LWGEAVAEVEVAVALEDEPDVDEHHAITAPDSA